MNVYNVIWPTFTDYMLPTFLRKSVIKALLNALMYGVRQLHTDFLDFRQSSLYRVKHTSQIASMEEVLNDIFDPVQRRIRIVNAVFKSAVYFYEPGDDKPVYFYEPEDNKPVYFYEADDIVGDGVDFSVCVPPDLQPGNTAVLEAFLSRMRGEVDYYKLYSKNYNIKWVLISD